MHSLSMSSSKKKHSNVQIGDFYNEGNVSWVVTNITKKEKVVLYSCRNYRPGASSVYGHGIPQIIDIADFIERRHWSLNN